MLPAKSPQFPRVAASFKLALALTAGGLALAFAATPAHADDQCTEADHDGCVELGATPPELTTAVPPNILLMLDDSGSMTRDYMPNSVENDGENALINAEENGVYYNPEVTYTPPPKAEEGDSYPEYAADDISNGDLPESGFDKYDDHTTLIEEIDGKPQFAIHNGGKKVCRFFQCHYEGGAYFFQYATKDAAGNYVKHYVAANSSDCGDAPDPGRCVGANDTSGESAPPGVAAGTNIANWFAYYHTRILAAKTALMKAFSGLSHNYRVGFGSINNRGRRYLPDDTYGGQVSTDIAEVRPFGDGSDDTQKAEFWNWLDNISPSGGTPMRRTLESAGEYFDNSKDAWATKKGDPNYNDGGGNDVELACRASYTILTTDGSWNSSNPDGKLKDAANEDGTEFTKGDGSTVSYINKPPFNGGKTEDDRVSLADVAAYYWKRDLRGTTSNLVPASRTDPAFWQHMTTFTMGLGVEPGGIQPDGTPIDDIFAWAHDGGGNNSSEKIDGFSWPEVNGGYNGGGGDDTTIADLAHAGVTGHGDFFSAKNPEEFAASFANAIAQIGARNAEPRPDSVNASVAAVGALSFNTGYSSTDWSGKFTAVELQTDGTAGEKKWDAGEKLNNRDWDDRSVYTDTYKNVSCDDDDDNDGEFDQGIAFIGSNASQLDCVQQAGLSRPSPDDSEDTLPHRIQYLLGDDSHADLYRDRNSRLGAIVNSEPLYVTYPSGGYYDSWPQNSPEKAATDNGNSYSQFVRDHQDREGTVYVGANDGMLHAFSAPAPENCDADGTNCNYGNGGKERWAFVPRAVYANLGNLTDADFKYRPTVDATPVSRDVFFDDADKWKSVLIGGVGIGGRGVYALDITNPTTFTQSNVLWELDADAKLDDCETNSGACDASDLGYTDSRPNIGRLANGKWVALIPNGYFPDCTQPDTPTHEAENGNKNMCKAIAADAPWDANDKPYSALFVVDIESGDVLAELKTPTDISDVTSYGLGSVVLGDYDNDQIDDVAYAGDLAGNLWRFDFSSDDPANWGVTLAYKGKSNNGHQGLQPITSLPRLFPDPATNRFMVVFGTGKYLAAGDNTADIPTQSVYGIRDTLDNSGDPVTATHSDLQVQTLTQEKITTGDLKGATARKLTNNNLSSTQLGWYIDLDAGNRGERVLANPGAIFASNTAVIQTLIPDSNNYCSPSNSGAAMFIDASTGGSGNGISQLGGRPFVGALVNNVSTGGSLPLVNALGGGSVYMPGSGLKGTGDNSGKNTVPLQGDVPVWRRRSWSPVQTQQ